MRKHLYSILIMGLLLPLMISWGNQTKKVLFISSYSEAFQTVPLQREGILSVFDPLGIMLDIEYMDSRRFPDETMTKLFYDMLSYKLQYASPYDAVIVGDDVALDFIMAHHDDLFKSIPVFFMGINSIERANTASSHPLMTGIIEAFSLKETIELGLTFMPHAQNIIAIVDDSPTGLGDKEQFYALSSHFSAYNYTHISTSEYSYKELETIFASIPSDSVVIYMTMFEDKLGAAMTLDESFDFLKAHVPVPVYRTSIGGVGNGLLGGKMVSYQNHGAYAAQMAVDYFNGKPLSDIPLVSQSPNEIYIDYNVLKAFNIDTRLIPSNAHVINRKISFYEANKAFVLGGIAFFFVLIVILFIVSMDNIKHRAMKKALHENHEELTAMYEEITASEEELREQYLLIQRLNKQYEISVQGTKSIVWELDLNTKALRLSGNVDALFGGYFIKEGPYDHILSQFTDEAHMKHFKQELNKHMHQENKQFTLQLELFTQSSEIKWLLVNGLVSTTEDFGQKTLMGIAMDITKLKEQEAHIDFLAYHDYLTQLPNRLGLMKRFENAILMGKKGAIFLLDLDNFKAINDTLGHFEGDNILKEVANRLIGLTSQDITVSRFGGDEFLILIENTHGIHPLIHRIEKAFEPPFQINEGARQIHYSMGITEFPKDSTDLNQLIVYADNAMYQVKYSGKNNHTFFKPCILEAFTEKARIELAIIDALENDGFTLVYQPQIHLASGNIQGYEALLRLRSSRVSPSEFIAVAEEQGLIKKIGRYVTQTVIQQLKAWIDKGYTDRFVSINFSSKQIDDDGYIDFLQRLLTENKVPSHLIEIEITESILLEERHSTIAFLNRLREIGVTLALDDFGTGYSSINYLTYLPLNKIKLDKTLIDKFFLNPDTKLLDNIINLIRNLSLTITAEGIEHTRQLEYLKACHCDLVQGYLFFRPLDVEAIEAHWDFKH